MPPKRPNGTNQVTRSRIDYFLPAFDDARTPLREPRGATGLRAIAAPSRGFGMPNFFAIFAGVGVSLVRSGLCAGGADAEDRGTRQCGTLPIKSDRPMRCSASRKIGQFSGS